MRFKARPIPSIPKLSLCRLVASGIPSETMGLALELAPALTIPKDEIDFALRVIGECITEEEKDKGL